jgi:hypothetical protein
VSDAGAPPADAEGVDSGSFAGTLSTVEGVGATADEVPPRGRALLPDVALLELLATGATGQQASVASATTGASYTVGYMTGAE